MTDPTASKAILDDLNRWSERRLKDWFLDSVDRYETMDVRQDEAITHTTATLMIVLAQILAKDTISAEKGAYELLKAIQEIRKIASRKEAAP